MSVTDPLNLVLMFYTTKPGKQMKKLGQQKRKECKKMGNRTAEWSPKDHKR